VSRASAEIDAQPPDGVSPHPFDELSESSLPPDAPCPLAATLTANNASRLAALFGEFRAHAAAISIRSRFPAGQSA